MARDPTRPPTLRTSLREARRLAVTKQLLSAPAPLRSGEEAILSAVRDLAYVQWDPVSIVAPSHLISLWARVPGFRPSELESLLWKRRELFLHWTPIASLVRTEDYPLYSSLMRRYPDSLAGSWGAQGRSAQKFLDRHSRLRAKILGELREGPRRLREFTEHSRTKRADGEWTPPSDVSQMLFHLSMSGEVMVVGHQGNQNLWGLSEGFLPASVKRGDLSPEEFDRLAAERAIRALGTASPSEINLYFVRGRYSDLAGALGHLVEESKIRRILVDGVGRQDVRYIHVEDIPLLEAMSSGAWQPRMVLLPPFDNMVSSPARARRLFGFEYVREQFLPPAKRRFGTYVLPILWGDRFIGRVDPRFDKPTGRLMIQAVHAEPEAEGDRAAASPLGELIDRLAEFLGAREVRYSSRVPEAWKGVLR